MREIGQTSKNEIKQNHINRLQENYNSIYKDYIETKSKYDRLVMFSIQTAFSEYNDDVELLLRCLYKQGHIKRMEDCYINPLFDDNTQEYKKMNKNPELLEEK